jgi:hypothetical protein
VLPCTYLSLGIVFTSSAHNKIQTIKDILAVSFNMGFNIVVVWNMWTGITGSIFNGNFPYR